MQAAFYGLRRERVEMATDPMRCSAKQPFDADAQTAKNSNEQQGFDSAVFTEVLGNAGAASPTELTNYSRRQISRRAD